MHRQRRYFLVDSDWREVGAIGMEHDGARAGLPLHHHAFRQLDADIAGLEQLPHALLVTSASRPNLRVRAQRAANHYLYAPSQESLEVGARLPGNHGVVSPVTSTRRSTSLSRSEERR